MHCLEVIKELNRRAALLHYDNKLRMACDVHPKSVKSLFRVNMEISVPRPKIFAQTAQVGKQEEA